MKRITPNFPVLNLCFLPLLKLIRLVYAYWNGKEKQAEDGVIVTTFATWHPRVIKMWWDEPVRGSPH